MAMYYEPYVKLSALKKVAPQRKFPSILGDEPLEGFEYESFFIPNEALDVFSDNEVFQRVQLVKQWNANNAIHRLQTTFSDSDDSD
jgi:hypothetical protein